MTDEKQERRGFEVKDRRRFSETGEVRSDAPDPAPEPTPPRPEPDPAAEQSVLSEPVTFSTFVLGLSTQALFLLGEIPNPETRVVERDLDGAKQVIDILGILREKTRNNLEPSEESMLDSILYDLRMRYVQLVQGGRKEGA
jgi:uncharacterized protein DUF1844